MLKDGKITFIGSQGHKLAARLDMPAGKIEAYALFAHCFTCTKDVFAAARIAKTLKEQGIAVLRFDFSGLGESEGDFGNTNFSSNVDDLIAAADFMRANNMAPSILIGHSLGGAAVLAAAHRIAETRAIVTIGAPADVAHVAHHFNAHRDEILQKGEADICLAGRPFRIKKQFIDDIEGVKMENYIRDLKKALLVMHAPLDQTVGIESASKIFAAAKHPKSYISLDDADHLLTRKEDAEYAANIIVSWSKKYLKGKTA